MFSLIKSAVVLKRWNRLVEEMRCDLEIVLHANYIKVNNDEHSQIHITKEIVNLIQWSFFLIKKCFAFDIK